MMIDESNPTCDRQYRTIPHTIEAMQYDPQTRNHDRIIAWAGHRVGAEPTRHRMFVRAYRIGSLTNWDATKNIEVRPSDWVCIFHDAIFVLSDADFRERYTQAAPIDRKKPGPKPKEAI